MTFDSIPCSFPSLFTLNPDYTLAHFPRKEPLSEQGSVSLDQCLGLVRQVQRYAPRVPVVLISHSPDESAHLIRNLVCIAE